MNTGRYRRLAWNIILAFFAVRSRKKANAAALIARVRSDDSRQNHPEVRPPVERNGSVSSLWSLLCFAPVVNQSVHGIDSKDGNGIRKQKEQFK